ncbi:MAG TPA: FUSC family membrane protein [Balneolaceae bacterium]|nr:FUSC family membrane protein [Balneolaceae bacterium]
MYTKIQQGIDFIRNAFRAEQFYVSLRRVVGSFIPLVMGEFLGFQHIGLQMMLGAFFISGVDIAGTLRAKASALFITTGISISITFLILITGGALWAILPLIFVFIFSLAYISPFSLRYTMMAIMGYIAIILALSMSGRLVSLSGILQHCFFMLCGSVWYIILALGTHYFFASTREINRRIAFCMRQTADYFDHRLALLKPEIDHHQGLLELARLQQELNTTQESVRELLFENTSNLTDRSSVHHRFYIIFVELIDMHELALATPIDYPKIRELLHRYPEYNIIRKIIQQFNKEMNDLADVLLNNGAYDSKSPLQNYYNQLQKNLRQLEQKIPLDNSEEEEAYHTLKQIEEYLHRQLQKFKILRNAVLNRQTNEEVAEKVSAEDLPRFITPNPLNWDSLSDYFGFDSSYFRCALRTATTAVAGYTLAYFLRFQNPYWVLLTVLVVMKPGYGVTKQRFYHRIAGTIAGAIIAYGIYQLHPGHILSLAIFGTALLLAFTFVVDSYAIASTFFTIFIIFLYSFLNRQIPTMVLYRVTDTILGAVLVILAIFYLWPYWEHQKFSYFIGKSLEANKKYLRKVLDNLFEPTFDETDYRLARKQAYVDMANVTSSYNRIKDDPKSKQKNVESFYNLALLNYMMLSATTSLAIFLQRFPDESLSYNQLRVLGNKIIENLNHALQRLDQPSNLKHYSSVPSSESEDIRQASGEVRQALKNLKSRLDKKGGKRAQKNEQIYTEYAHLNHLSRQIEWMLELSRSIVNFVYESFADDESSASE